MHILPSEYHSAYQINVRGYHQSVGGSDYRWLVMIHVVHAYLAVDLVLFLERGCTVSWQLYIITMSPRNPYREMAGRHVHRD